MHDAQDDIIKLFDLFDARFWVGNVFGIRTPKDGPPQLPNGVQADSADARALDLPFLQENQQVH
jgi:hypothetical protein